ncbi:glucosamine kinase [Mycolicibacterium vaccae]|uniref:glucosamine kinase n=1 Tax=Mycolicibacterium vaccae TaxID=1810 RepID=UPI003CFB3ED0
MPTDAHPATTDVLTLGDRHALAIIDRSGTLSAVPLVGVGDDRRRAAPGDGASGALVRMIADTPGRARHGRFSVVSWTDTGPQGSERPITVDQTNESVVVGDRAVVKWATHLEPGPHPAPGRLAVLAAAGFSAMPPPLGVITWTPDGGAETLVATVTGYLPGAVDGWTWAKEMFTGAASSGDLTTVTATFATLGGLVADLHAAMSSTAVRSTAADARRWRDNAVATLAEARSLAAPATAALLTERADEITALLDGLADLVDVPILDAHGDLHVGQVLRSGDRLVLTDFDGNPVLHPTERVRPVPAAVDLAGLLQSVCHVAVVTAKRAAPDPDRLRAVDTASRTALREAYLRRLAETGHADLHLEAAVPALRLQQVLREIVYAARHLPRWMYVPDAALPALLSETSR